MSKLGEDGKPIYNKSGKVMKGPKYFKPDLTKFVDVFEVQFLITLNFLVRKIPKQEIPKINNITIKISII